MHINISFTEFTELSSILYVKAIIHKNSTTELMLWQPSYHHYTDLFNMLNMRAACHVYSVQYVPELQSVTYIVFVEYMIMYVIMKNIIPLIIQVTLVRDRYIIIASGIWMISHSLSSGWQLCESTSFVLHKRPSTSSFAMNSHQ